MRFFFLAMIMAAGPIFGAGRWIEYQDGPFRVVSDAGDRAARERLTEMEQLRHVLGALLGKEGLGLGGSQTNGLETIWPVEVILFSSTREYGPHALHQPFIDGGSATLGAWTADTPLPRDMLRALTRLLIDNAGQMPESVETALCDLFSTIKVNATKVMLGAPLPAGELPPDRMRAWAKMQMLATNPDYSGKLRVYLNNLQQGGDEALAARNAFDLTVAKLDAQADAYLRAGDFAAAPVSGEPLSPNRDFIEKPIDKTAVDALIAELSAGGKNFPLESPRGLLAKGTQPALEQAAKANPRWGEPHFRLAALETSSTAKIKELKIATTLEPRHVSYWQALAEAQSAADLYADAGKSWAAAEHAASTEAEKARIRLAHADLDARRADYEAAEKRRIAEEQAQELQRIKNAAAAEVHAAENAANQQLHGDVKSAPVPWWGDPEGEKISGTLTRVECLNGGVFRLTIVKGGSGSVRLLVRDAKQLVTHGSEPTFGCGIQKPPRKVTVVYSAKPDSKLGTAGDVAMLDFP